MILTHSVKVCLATQPCDLRKSFDTLSCLVVEQLKEDPLSSKLFVFLNKRTDRVNPADKGVITHLALINRLLRWWKQTTADDPVGQWDEEQRDNVKKDFGLLLAIYKAL